VKLKMKSIGMLVLLLCGGGADAAPIYGSKLLVGRWQSDAVETGYYIVDRYADGRFAEKEFLLYDLSKQSEICVTWGRWRLIGSKYEERIDGSTSSFLSGFSGKWIKLEVVEIGEKRFGYMSDNYPRYEIRNLDLHPLLEVPIEVPKNLEGINKQVIRTSLKSVPNWVNGCSK
jgi:hypothetical protein